MNRFYTNVEVWGGKILYRGMQNGKQVMSKVDYHPSLFVPSKEPTKYKTIHGEYLGKVNPGTIRDCRDFVKQYEDVDNFTIYGMQRYQYCFIADEYPGTVNWDMSELSIANIDIEVGSDNGFPEPDDAKEPLTAITVCVKGHYHTFGCGAYENSNMNVTYYKSRDEQDLIMNFLGWWQSNYPDAITGWNVEAFDIPYLVNRIRNVYGDKVAERLSP